MDPCGTSSWSLFLIYTYLYTYNQSPATSTSNSIFIWRFITITCDRHIENFTRAGPFNNLLPLNRDLVLALVPDLLSTFSPRQLRCPRKLDQTQFSAGAFQSENKFLPFSSSLKMPIRNPFTRRQADEAGLRPPLSIEPPLKTPPGFERVDTVGSKASSAISISSRRSQDTGEYKMSGTHDN